MVKQKSTSTKRTRKPAPQPEPESATMRRIASLERHALDAIAAYDGLMAGVVYAPDMPSTLVRLVGDIRTLRLMATRAAGLAQAGDLIPIGKGGPARDR